MVTERGTYVAGKRLTFGPAYPIVQGFKKRPAFGYYFHSEDPMQFKQITGSLRLLDRVGRDSSIACTRRSTTIDELGLSTSITAPTFTTCSDRSSAASRATPSSRYNKTRIYDPPRQLDMFGSAAAYFGLETLPGAQNIESPSNIFSVEAGLKYRNCAVHSARSTAKRVSPGGHRRTRSSPTARCFPEDQRRHRLRHPAPAREQLGLALRHAGKAWGNAGSPLSSFYFGSFRNNYVDNRTVKRYREMDSFPGFEIDEISARTSAR